MISIPAGWPTAGFGTLAQVELDHPIPIELDEAAMLEERQSVGVALRHGGLEPGLADRACRPRPGDEERRPDALTAVRLAHQHGHPPPFEVGPVAEDLTDGRHPDGLAGDLGDESFTAIVRVLPAQLRELGRVLGRDFVHDLREARQLRIVACRRDAR